MQSSSTTPSWRWRDVSEPSGGPVKIEDLDRAPNALQVAPGAVDQNDFEAYRQKFTEVSEENIALKTEIEALKNRVRTSEILDSLIAPYAERAFGFMCAYCAGVAFMLLLSGGNVDGFHLDKEVLVLMVGSTAVTVIGLVGMVLTGIFVGARGKK